MTAVDLLRQARIVSILREKELTLARRLPSWANEKRLVNPAVKLGAAITICRCAITYSDINGISLYLSAASYGTVTNSW